MRSDTANSCQQLLTMHPLTTQHLMTLSTLHPLHPMTLPLPPPFQSIATSNDEDDDLEEEESAAGGGVGVGGGGGGATAAGGGGVSNYHNINHDNDNNDDDNDCDGEMVTVLDSISLSIPSGSLTAICGSTGSGKSTLLSGILGECKQLGGKTSLRGKVSFVAQSAW